MLSSSTQSHYHGALYQEAFRWIGQRESLAYIDVRTILQDSFGKVSQKALRTGVFEGNDLAFIIDGQIT